MVIQRQNRLHIGKRNLRALYGFAGTSRLWFDGGLWVIYFQHQGVSLFEIGLLEALLHIVAVVSDVPIGAFADRFGWKVSLACGTVLGVGYTVTALFAHSFWWIALAFAARGLQITLSNGSDASLAYESAVWANMTDRYRAISGRMFAIGLVSLGIAEAVGGRLASVSWPLVYVAFTAANVLSFVVVLFIKEPRDIRTRVDAESEHQSVLVIFQSAVQFARKNPYFLRWIVFSGTLSGFVATFAFYGQAMLLHAGWTLMGIGVLMGVENGVGACAAMLSDKITGRYGERRTLGLVSGLTSTGLILFSWLPGIWAGVGYLMDSVATSLADPVIDQGLNRIIPSGQRATLLSANSTAFSLFMVVGFPMFGVFAKFVGLENAAHVASVLAVGCILATALSCASAWGSGSCIPDPSGTLEREK